MVVLKPSTKSASISRKEILQIGAWGGVSTEVDAIGSL